MSAALLRRVAAIEGERSACQPIRGMLVIVAGQSEAEQRAAFIALHGHEPAGVVLVHCIDASIPEPTA